MVKNSLAKKDTSLSAYLTQNAVKNQINSILGNPSRGSRFISSIVSAVQTNKELKLCTNPSIVSGALLGESLNLSPSPQLGQYYLVPFNNHGTSEAVFILGYKGYIQLAIRSGQYKKLNVLAIKDGELVSFDPLNEEIEVNLIQDEEAREKAATIGYYAMFEYTNGFRKSMYWSREKMQAHALKYSKGYAAHKGYTFWEKDFDSMAYKTMLRQIISKWGIMSIDLQNAIINDNAVIREDGTPDYVDNEKEQETVMDESTEAHEEPEPEHMDASNESKEDFSMNAPASPEEAEALFES